MPASDRSSTDRDQREMPALQKALTDVDVRAALPVECDVNGGDLAGRDRFPGMEVELSQAERIRLTEGLIADYHEAVYRYAFWLSGCRASAEDITQEVFLRAFRAIHKLRETKAAKSWLMTITRNESTRTGKKQRPTPVGEISEMGELIDDQQQSLAENSEWVSRGLAELSDDYREVVLMFYFEQLSYTEIADSLGIPIGTVMSRLNRGRTHLRKSLIRLEDPMSDAPAAKLEPGNTARSKLRVGPKGLNETEKQSGQ